MDRSGDVTQRLAIWIRSKKDGKPLSLYRLAKSPDRVVVVEPSSSGKAEVTCPIPDGCECIEWQINENDLFMFLQETNNADGALLLRRPNGDFEAHIIECKKTVDQTKWPEILVQIQWTLGRLLAIAGVIDIKIQTAILGTAYRYDRLSEEESPNPTSGKPALDAPALRDLDEEQLNNARLKQLAWMNDEVHLPGFQHPFRHVKIKLDEQTGSGSYHF